MAIRKVSEGVVAWNNKMPFPKDRYTVKCQEEKLEVSKAGNPMLVREFEIVAPDVVPSGDRMVSVAGKTITQWRVCKVHVEGNDKEWDQEKSDKSFGTVSEELRVCGFTGEEIDDENPPLFLKGKTFDAILYAKEETARKSPTAEQLKKGQKQGDPIKDANGKEVHTYQLQIETILGPSTVEANTPY